MLRPEASPSWAGVAPLRASLADPVTKKPFSMSASSPHEDYRGQHFFFAGADSKAKFDAAPEQYVTMFGESSR